MTAHKKHIYTPCPWMFSLEHCNNSIKSTNLTLLSLFEVHKLKTEELNSWHQVLFWQNNTWTNIKLLQWPGPLCALVWALCWLFYSRIITFFFFFNWAKIWNKEWRFPQVMFSFPCFHMNFPWHWDDSETLMTLVATTIPFKKGCLF